MTVKQMIEALRKIKEPCVFDGISKAGNIKLRRVKATKPVVISR